MGGGSGGRIGWLEHWDEAVSHGGTVGSRPRPAGGDTGPNPNPSAWGDSGPGPGGLRPADPFGSEFPVPVPGRTT